MVALQAPVQSYDRPGAIEATLKDMDDIYQYQTIARHNKIRAELKFRGIMVFGKQQNVRYCLLPVRTTTAVQLTEIYYIYMGLLREDVIKWKHFPDYWPFLRGIKRSPANSPHKGQWRGALLYSLICSCTNGWANSRDAGDACTIELQ